MNALPAKGTTFRLPSSRRWGKSPLKVTSTRGDIVYFAHAEWGGSRGKITATQFERFAAEVVAPEPQPAKPKAPRMSAAECEGLHRRAHAAGMEAGNAHQPVPMHVVERVNPFDDNSAVKRDYGVYAQGVCGFAWVRFPGTGSFARWAMGAGLVRKSAEGGYMLWVRGFGQSYEKKAAYAAAYAAVLVEAGVQAEAEGRLD